MDKKLLVNAVVRTLAGFVLMGGLLFVPAGTIAYENGWLFILLLGDLPGYAEYCKKVKYRLIPMIW